MFKTRIWIYFGILCLLLVSCASPTPVMDFPTLMPTKVIPTIAVPTATTVPQPTATPLPPTSVPPTSLPPTATPDPNSIKHLNAGQEFTITKIQMFSATEGWGIGGLVGVGDHIFKTNDGGSTWKDLTPPEPAPVTGRKTALGFFQSLDIAWVSFYGLEAPIVEAPVVWHTADGGKTWQASQPLDVKDLNEFFTPSDIQFADLQTGWLLSHVGVGMNHDYVALYKTSDGGGTWTRLLDPYNDGGIMSCQKTAMLFTDTQNGWLTGDCNGVAPGVLLFRTADGGSTWEKITLPAPASAPNLYDVNTQVACGSYSPFFFTNQIGKLVVQCVNYSTDARLTDYYLYSTQDGGNSWTSATYPGGSLTFMATDIGLALGKEIYKTSDAGKTWTKISTVDWVGQFNFISEQLGWAVVRSGDKLALVFSKDGGVIWAILTPKVAP